MAYSPPAKDTVHFVGGLGTKADARAGNGCGATKVAWDAGIPSDFIDTNGGPIYGNVNCTYTHATKNINKTGIGTNTVVGTLAYVSGTNITTGRYEVTTVTDNNNIICANIDSTGDNADTQINIGGAIDKLQDISDDDSTDASSYNRTILTSLDETGLGASIDLDTGQLGGIGANVWKRVIGCDNTMTKLARGSYVTYSGNIADTGVITFELSGWYLYGIKASNNAITGDGFYYGGNTGPTKTKNLVLENCWGSSGTSGAGLQADTNYGRQNVLLIDSYFSGENFAVWSSYDIAAVGCYFVSSGIVVITASLGDGSFFDRCVFDHGTKSIAYNGNWGIRVTNCVFYSPSVNCIEAANANAFVIEYNNIFMPDDADTDKGIITSGGGGSIGYSNYSCGWDIAENTNATSDHWMNSANTYAYTEGGDNSIQVDPLLLDPANDDFRLLPTSACLDTGIPTPGDI